MKKLIVLSISIVAVFGCTKSHHNDPKDIALVDQHAIYDGSLEKKMRELYSSEDSDLQECDLLLKSRVLELVQDLDAHQALIKTELQNRRTQEDPNHFHPVDIDGFRITRIDFPKSDEHGWQVDLNSWNSILIRYQRLKRTGKGSWAALDSSARYLIPDEEDRLLGWRHPLLKRENGPKFIALHDKFVACEKIESCTEVTLTAAERDFMEWSSAYAFWFAKLKKTEDPSAKRAILAKMTKRLERESSRYEFRKAPYVHQDSHGVFTVDFNFGPFGNSPESIEKFSGFLKHWSNDVHHVVINGVDDTNSTAIKVAARKGEVGRSSVDWEGRTMELFDGIDEKAIAHEFGHALGFRDEYYTSWDGGSCAYMIEKNADDIMSEHQPGHVLPEHWQQLEKSYPAKN